MSADIIEFPKSKKQLELEAMQDYVKKAKIAIARNCLEENRRYDVPNVAGIPVKEPNCRRDYLTLCKEFLEVDDYQDVLCGIMDKEHYDALEDQLQKVIDSYYSFKR